MEQKMNAARSKADENRQRFDELDKQGEEIRTQLDKLKGSDGASSRFYAVRIFIRAAIVVIIAVTLAAWWLMRDAAPDLPASASDAAMSDVK